MSRVRPTFYLDFDGTIVDNRWRMYSFCCDWFPVADFSRYLSIEDYWAMKRLRIDEARWFAETLSIEVDAGAWRQAKLGHIEDDKYLQMDALIPNALEALKGLSDLGDVVLVSRRERADALYIQIERLGVAPYFSDVTVIDHQSGTKADVVKARYDVYDCDYFIGDTEDDFSTGLELGIRTVLVLSGIRAGWLFEKMKKRSGMYVERNLMSFYKRLRDGFYPSNGGL